MLSEFSAQRLHALADEHERLVHVAEAAERFMQHIAGFQIVDESGSKSRIVLMDEILEARALKAALKDLMDV